MGKNWMYTGIMVVSLVLILGGCGTSGREIALYVSPDGSDTAQGTEGKPFATVTRARDAVRELMSAGKVDRPVTVYLRGGVYELTEPVVFTPEDSGTAATVITYRAYPGETPIISGGSAIEGGWREAANGLMMVDIPAVREGWRFRQLFLGDERQQRSREPDGEYYTVAQTDEDTGRTGMRFRDDHFARWDNIGDVEVVVYHFWNESRCRVASLDTAGKLVTFTGRVGGRGIGRSDYMNRYYIENARELIDEPGEWYLDIHAGTLYYLPPAGADLTTLRAPRLREIMRLQGDRENGRFVEYLLFSGITFRLADWDLPAQGYPSCGDVGDIVPPSAVTFDGAAHCVFEQNTIRNTGSYALEITGHDNLITSNHIHDTGSGGVITRSYSGGPNRIVYNHIHDCGRVYVSAVGVNVDDGGGYIAHNLVHHTTHTGIYGRHWATATQERERRNQEQGLVIEFNEIHDCMHDMNDGGGIFIRDSDIVINNNLIYNIWASPVGHGSPGFGFYLGCETRNTMVKNNVIYRAKAGQLVWFSNRNNTITNNVMVDCGEVWGQINFSNPQDRNHENVRVVRNIFAYNLPEGIFYNCAHDRSVPVESDYNIIWNAGGPFPITGVTGVENLDGWRAKGYDTHSVVADPCLPTRRTTIIRCNLDRPRLNWDSSPSTSRRSDCGAGADTEEQRGGHHASPYVYRCIDVCYSFVSHNGPGGGAGIPCVTFRQRFLEGHPRPPVCHHRQGTGHGPWTGQAWHRCPGGCYNPRCVYELSEPVVFTTADSGTETCPVTYRAAPGETPIISGGRHITGPWRRYRDGIMVLDLPEAKDGGWNFRQLFRDGKRQVRARTPNRGYLIIEETDPELGKTALRYKAGDVAAWGQSD